MHEKKRNASHLAHLMPQILKFARYGRGLVVPLIFALLENKDEVTYTTLLEALKELEPTLKPVSVTVDFERAEHNAFEAAFPGVQLRGCLFHFAQCIWRQIQAHAESLRMYNDPENPDNSLNIRTLTALALVPHPYAGSAYKALIDSSFWKDNADKLEDILDYFEKSWLGRKTRRGWVNPKFGASTLQFFKVCPEPTTRLKDGTMVL
jgi:hypothetical protein